MKIAIIGAGVIGLTTAICLQNEGYDVTIYSKEMPQNTTSIAAGAVWWGYGEGQVRQWARHSLKIFQNLILIENSGVKQLRLRDMYPHEVEIPWFHSHIPYFEEILESKLPEPYRTGFIMDVPLVEPPRYLPYLLNRFQGNNGEIILGEIQSFVELAIDYRLIVNCTGVGARKLANDEAVYPIRGQTVVVDAPEIKGGFMDDHHFTYIFPRSDGVLLGGIAHENREDMALDVAIREDIVQRCSAIDDRLKNRPIVHETVGLRPGRYAVRLEREQFSDNCQVIHNYGHGAIGFTLSWGCAADVVKLAQESI